MADFDRYEERRRHWEERMERRRQRWEAHWAGDRPHGGFRGLFIGVILTAIGVILLLQNLDILHIVDLWRYWPVILIVLGTSRLVSAYSSYGRGWGALVALVGVLFLLHNLGILRHDAWNYIWPVVLIALGVGMLGRSINRRRYWRPPAPPGSGGGVASAGTTVPGPTGPLSPSGDALQNALNEWAFFGGVRRRIDSQEFEGGELLAIFGGIQIDLDRAGTKRDEIRIDANALFGGIDIRVPDTWAVTVRGTGILGGYDDKTVEPHPTEGKPPHLIITGVAVFGGVTVKN